jgi:hypothetical protein
MDTPMHIDPALDLKFRVHFRISHNRHVGIFVAANKATQVTLFEGG